jgi:hypothetical protein
MSISAAPVYGHTDYKLIALLADPATPSASTEISSKAHNWGYSFGLLGHYAFSSRWSASVGVWATQSVSAKGEFAVDGNKTMITYPNNHPFEYAYKIPVLLTYQGSTHRLAPYFSAGATLNFRPPAYVNINGTEAPVKFGKAVTVVPLVGIGAIYRLNERLSLIAQPTIQYTIESRPTYSYYHAYQLSLQTQLQYRF